MRVVPSFAAIFLDNLLSREFIILYFKYEVLILSQLYLFLVVYPLTVFHPKIDLSTHWNLCCLSCCC